MERTVYNTGKNHIPKNRIKLQSKREKRNGMSYEKLEKTMKAERAIMPKPWSKEEEEEEEQVQY